MPKKIADAAHLTLTPRKTEALLKAAITNALPVLLVGPPGVGKSDIVAQVAAALDHNLIVSHPVVSDPTDYKGLPWPSEDHTQANFLPFGDLARMLKASKPTIVLLDDVGQASPAVQAALMQLLLARRVGEHVLPECVTFVAATNRRQDRAGVSGILEPVKSRFATIVELEPSLPDWCAWAAKNDEAPEVIGFLNFRPELFHQFEATADLTNSPCPRTWHRVSQWVKADLPRELQIAAYAGAVGIGAATEFSVFARTYQDLVSPDAILMAPDTAPIPNDPSALYATAAGIAAKATRSNSGRYFRYLERLLEAQHGEFSALSLQLAFDRDKTLLQTLEARNSMSGPLGNLLGTVGV